MDAWILQLHIVFSDSFLVTEKSVDLPTDMLDINYYYNEKTTKNNEKSYWN